MTIISCIYLVSISLPSEWRGQNTSLGKTEPTKYKSVCGHPRRLNRPCPLVHSNPSPCKITDTMNPPEN